MAQQDLQQEHEATLSGQIRVLLGRGKESDWALVRALVHRAVHVAAEQKVEFCQIATLLSEMITHAHQVVHPPTRPEGHSELQH